jgi:hypothetical protein
LRKRATRAKKTLFTTANNRRKEERRECTLRPEQANVRDVEEDKSEALKTESKGPSDLSVCVSTIAQNKWMDDTTPKNFQPLGIEKDLQFEGRCSEGKVGIHPACVSVRIEESVYHSNESLL